MRRIEEAIHKFNNDVTITEAIQIETEHRNQRRETVEKAIRFRRLRPPHLLAEGLEMQLTKGIS